MRLLMVFLFFWFAVMIGALAYQSMTGRERWATLQLLSFGFVTAVAAFVLLVGIVFVF